MSESESILVIGASVRSAVYSAFCGQMKTYAIDLFGDLDLQTICFAQTVESLSVAGFENIQLDPLPKNLVITGGMECKPELLRWLCKTKNLVGPTIASIEKTNDVVGLQEICGSCGIRFPQVIVGENCDRSPVDHVAKPYNSTGGFRVQDWCDNDDLPSAEYYLQKFIPGKSMSSVFCATSNAIELVGTTKQLTGTFLSNRNKYRYCGSIGPVHLNDSVVHQIRCAGEILAQELQLVGIFGLDWILDAHQNFWLIEINPRWTASCEIFDRQGVVANMFGAHLDAIWRNRLPQISPHRQQSGKLIVFNQSHVTKITRELVEQLVRENQRLSKLRFADIPREGTVINGGAPAMTIYTDGDTDVEIEKSLMALHTEIQSRINLS